MTVYFEQFEVGDTRTIGETTVSEADIVAFAEQFDPQPFHVDPEAAAASPFGGLVASGWHTASLTMRVLVDDFLSDAATHGALGIDELRWREPVRPGDTLLVSTEVVDTEPWSDEAGKVDVRVETETEAGTVMSMVSLVLFARRDPLGDGE
jgi:acyl dehydratase